MGARGAKSMTVVRAALALMNSQGFSEQTKMYGFLVAVEGMEPCEARALAYDHPVTHGGEACEQKRGSR